MTMGLKTESGSGDFLPRIQYDARAGRFFRVERTQDSGGNWQNNTDEIMVPTAFAFDFDTLEVGWIKLANGVDFKMVPHGQPLPAQPGPDYKQGFRVKVYNKQIGVRHWNHTAKCVLQAVDQVHTAWEKDRSSNRGQVPIVAIDKTIAVTTGQGARQSTNYAPVLRIDKWIDRPKDFDAGGNGAAKPGGNGNGSAAAKPAGAQHVEAPAAQAARSTVSTEVGGALF